MCIFNVLYMFLYTIMYKEINLCLNKYKINFHVNGFQVFTQYRLNI